MTTAEDFLRAFFKQYPEAESGKLSMEELNGLLAEFQGRANSKPLDEFDGLSPEQMSVLLQAPFTPESTLQIHKDIEDHLELVPLLKLSELLIAEIRNAGTLKLTKMGNLPVRVCELLYSQKLIDFASSDYLLRITEDDVSYLWPLKQYLLDEGIVKKRNNALSLTKQGEKFIAGSKVDRFLVLLTYFTSNFHWNNFYELGDDGKYGRTGWAYSLVMLSKYGSQPRSSEFYSLKSIRAFEGGLWEIHKQDAATGVYNDYHRAYATRFFACFSNWFGLVNMEDTGVWSAPLWERLKITKSPLFDHLFQTL